MPLSVIGAGFPRTATWSQKLALEQLGFGPCYHMSEALDQFFLDRLERHMDELIAIPQEEYMRLGGTEAAELAIWFSMRAALSDDIRKIYEFRTFPKITGCGVIAFEERGS